MMIRSRDSFSGASPGLSCTAASPTKPTATTWALASTRGLIRSGRLTSTSTLFTSTSRTRAAQTLLHVDRPSRLHLPYGDTRDLGRRAGLEVAGVLELDLPPLVAVGG